MGVVYKLTPELKEFIIKQKGDNPPLSCRKISLLIKREFNVSLSKSSVNNILKNAGTIVVSSVPLADGDPLSGKILPLEAEPAPAVQEEAKIISVEPDEAAVPHEVPPAEVVPPAAEESVPVAEQEAKVMPVEQASETAVPHEVPPVEIAPPAAEEPVPAAEQEAKVIPVEPAHMETIARLAPVEAGVCSGLVLFKAIDYIVGGTAAFAEAISARVGTRDEDLREKIEALMYAAFLEAAQIPGRDAIAQIQALTGKAITQELLGQEAQKLQGMPKLYAELMGIIPGLLEEVRSLRGTLTDNQNFCLDGVFHTVWSTLNIPFDFSSPGLRIKNYIRAAIAGSEPWVLFNAPGYDMPNKEFFVLLQGLEGYSNKIEKFALYNHALEELEVVPVFQSGKRSLVFSVWPWQFTGCRKVYSIGEFKALHLESLPKEFQSAEAAEIDIELSQPSLKKTVRFRGAALKLEPAGKIRLLILTNLAVGQASPAQLVLEYLGRWPNFEEGFQDYSRKIELFTYAAAPQRSVPLGPGHDGKEPMEDIRGVMRYYRKALESYLCGHFLPSGFGEREFVSAQEHFYKMSASFAWKERNVTISFNPGAGFAYAKELEYISRRLNERNIRGYGDRKLWFGPAG